MNQQRDFSMQLAKCGIGGKRYSDQIPHTANIHHDLVGAFIGKPAAKLSNHRSPVLPLSLRPSTQSRGSLQRGESDTPLGARPAQCSAVETEECIAFAPCGWRFA